MVKETIVFKVPEFPHVTETFILNQILRALDLGYDVKILVRKLLEINQWNSEVRNNYNYLLNKVVVENFNVPKKKIERVMVWLKIILFDLHRLKAIYLYHKQKNRFSLTWLFEWKFFQQFDTVKLFHVHYGTNQYPLIHLKKSGFQPKLICSFHGHDAFFPINGFIQNNGYYDEMIEHFDHIVANTPYLANQLKILGFPEEKLHQIPVTIDVEKFKPPRKAKKNSIFTLITVGRLHQSKGHIFLLQALKKIIDQGLDVQLIIIGAGSELEKLQSYVKLNELTDYIHFTGVKSSNEIIEFLNKSHLFVFTPITLENGWAESQGLVISEAMACGLPVIAFNTGGVRYTFDDNSGYLIKERDIDDLVLKTKLFFNNRKLLDKMGIFSRDFVLRNYSNNVVQEKWQFLYGS